MRMNRQQWALGIVGTLVLGALGSGLWEIGGKPIGQTILSGILTAVTFGSTALKDSIYQEAAKGNHEGASLDIWLTLVVVYVGLLALLVTWNFSETSRLYKHFKSLEAAVTGQETNVGEEFLSLAREVTPKLRLLKKLGVVVTCAAVFLAGSKLTDTIKMMASNAAYTFFDQSFVICRPYLDEHTAQVIKSRYAQVHTRDDYIVIVQNLRSIATSNHLRLPSYEPW